MFPLRSMFLKISVLTCRQLRLEKFAQMVARDTCLLDDGTCEFD